jgi:putative DNA primase/helicase
LKNWIPCEDTRKYLQEFIGYSLINSNRFHKALVLVGKGANGKSMFLNAVSKLFKIGIMSPSLQDFQEKFELSEFEKASVIISQDIDSNKIFSTGNLKKFIAGEKIRGHVKGKKSIEYIPSAKIIMSANYLPKTVDKSDGFIRRFDFIRFPKKFKVNPNFENDFKNKINSSAFQSYLLSWAIEGLKRLLCQNTFTYSKSILQEKNKYINKNDFVKEFIDDIVIHANNQKNNELSIKDIVIVDFLYKIYQNHCNNENEKVLSKNDFTERLNDVCSSYEKQAEVKRVNVSFPSARIKQRVITFAKINKENQDVYNEYINHFDNKYSSKYNNIRDIKAYNNLF